MEGTNLKNITSSKKLQKNCYCKLILIHVLFLITLKQNSNLITVLPRLSIIICSSLLVENRFVQELKHFFPQETMVSILIRFTQKKNT